MASNMDGVGTFAMARVLQEFKMLTVIRKHYTIDDWKEAAGTGLKNPNTSVVLAQEQYGTKTQKINSNIKTSNGSILITLYNN